METYTEYRVIYKNAILKREYEWGTYHTLRGAQSNAVALRKAPHCQRVRIESREVSCSDWKAV